MPDWIILSSASCILLTAALDIFGGPFLIGRNEIRCTAWSYILELIKSAAGIILAGRCLGWW